MLECVGESCANLQSALLPAGAEAADVATLFWILAAGAILIWLMLLGTAVYAVRVDPGKHDQRHARRFIIWGGVALPTLVLAAVLGYGLTLLTDFRAPGDGLRIAVSGERFWWRLRYHAGDKGSPWSETFAEAPHDIAFDSANELHLPAGERVELYLYSPDVIHSFWIPSMAGKIDMIPGRVNRLVLEPTRPGVYRGVCAEFCGTSHGVMAFDVIVSPRDQFQQWLKHQASSASLDDSHSGFRAFMANGCGACHSVRGTDARGRVGPDLTHLGSRRSVGTSLLANNAENIARFIAEPAHVKPGVAMPAFGMLPDKDIEAIAAWLEGLQ